MCKKLLLAAVIGVVAFSALKGTKIFNYAKSEVAAVGEWVESQVPPEKKISHLRKEVKQLDRDIEKAQSALAAEIVDVERLAKDVASMKTAVTTERKAVLAFGEKIKDATGKVSHGSYTISPEEAKTMLSSKVKSVSNRENTLGSMEQTLNARERIKDALQKQVDGLRQNKLELAVAIDKLDAELKVLQYQQIESKYQVDDTRLANVKQSLRELQREVDIQRQKLKMAPAMLEETSLAGNLSVEDILAPLTKKTPEPKNDD
jgi:chromosome segregation ATPase